MTKLTTSLLLMLALGASGCATLDPGTFLAKRLGASAGTSLADALPVQAATSVSDEGACEALRGLKGPVAVAGLPRNAATEFALAADKFGAEHHCWPTSPPKETR